MTVDPHDLPAAQGTDSALATAARVAALTAYGILDTPPEPGFDDVVAIASALCATPVALVSLLDSERQWFKAKTGLEACETPIGQAVCAHVLRERQLLVIPDLTLDPRTSANPLVTDDPKIRFYAGAPLITPSGVAIGTVCVIDLVPRPEGLTDMQARGLEALARQAMALIEMRGTIRHRTDILTSQFKARLEAEARQAATEAASAVLVERETRSRLAEEAAGVGTFEVDVATSTIKVSAEFCRIFGVPPLPVYPASTFENLVVADDSEVPSNVESRTSATAATDVEYRIRRADDRRLRWIGRRAMFLRDDTGKVVSMYGAAQDITDLKRADLQARTLLELGDRLRNATTTADAAAAASEALARVLSAPRAGFAHIDFAGGSFVVEQDWVNEHAASIEGNHALSLLPGTFERLKDGRPFAVDDVAEAGLNEDSLTYVMIGARAFINIPLLVQGVLTGCLFVHDGAPREWQAEDIAFAENVADLTYAAIRKLRAEAERQTLNQELSHRLKNTLAMVLAMSRQTLRGVPDRAPVDAFEQRIHALSKANDILVQENWSEARIRTVVGGVLQTFGEAERFDVSGPDLRLGPRTTLSLTLIVHELATNALKYGALSAETGRVRVGWDLKRDGAAPELVLRWRESGGPPVSPPSQKSFGSRLIGMGLSGTGGVAIAYPSTGVEVELSAPLSKLAL